MRLPFNFRPKITPSCATAIAVSLLPLLYFLPATRGLIVISPDDGIIFNVPMRVAVADMIRAGHWPLWNPYIFGGLPLFGVAQAGVLFPLNWFYLAFAPPLATNLMMLSSYMMAALGAYLYARRSGSSIAGAALTSLVWQWGAVLVGHIGHTNILQTGALLPWLLWAVDGYGGSGKRSHGLVLAALVALQVFAGHPQTLAYSLLVVTAYAGVMWRANFSPKHPRAYLWSLVFAAAGLALAAVQILPTLEMLRHSLRADASYDFFTSFSLPPNFLWTFFAPYVVGGGDGYLFRAPYVGPAFYAEYVGYVGLGTIALAGLAWVLRRDARAKFWSIVALVGLVLALGRFAPFGFYKLIYAVPVLNLFRVPARHLMEVVFALAVLAGYGLTAITTARDRGKTLRWVAGAGAFVFVLTCLAVTVGRPASFHLGRIGPVSILRAPELFLPIVLAAASGGALWLVARGRRMAQLLLLAVVSLDLCVWGQSSGWRVGSPGFGFEFWHEPTTVQFLRGRAMQGEAVEPYRILTQECVFAPAGSISAPASGDAWVPSLQPDMYMMYGVENAAGYDGFGMARYSRLAGDMKVWGDLADRERTLRSESRELDLLNVRYLLVRSSWLAPAAAGKDFPATTQTYGGERFSAESLDMSLGAGESLSFTMPPVEADHLALLAHLACSEAVADGEIVARIRLHIEDGRTLDFEVRAGDQVSEWAYDRPDVRSRIKHRLASVGMSYPVKDAQGSYQAHSYVLSFALPRSTVIDGGEIVGTAVTGAPNLTIGIGRIAFAGAKDAFPLRAAWVKKVVPRDTRWTQIADLGTISIFENGRVLPRAWLAGGELVTTGEEALAIIRTGKTPDGARWDPREQVLVERPTGIAFAPRGAPESRAAVVVRHEPNRVEVETESSNPAVLVLAENHYPGWRAFVDGRSVLIARVNYNQRGVALPAGKHLVTFVYRPVSVLAGLGISLLTLTALGLWSGGIVGGRRTRRKADVSAVVKSA